MTIRAAPIASGAITPDAAGMTVQPTVRTRKKVPMNSATYFFILVLWIGEGSDQIARARFCIGTERGGKAIFPLGEFSASIRHSVFAIRRRRVLPSHLVPDGPEIVENRLEKRLF